VLLWQRYDNKMVAMRYYVLHLQQYSHRLNFFLRKFLVLLTFDARNFVVFYLECYIFSAFAIIADTVAGGNPRELQILARFSPASIFLFTNILVPKVTVFLVLLNPFLQKKTICLFDGHHGWKNHNQLQRTALK